MKQKLLLSIMVLMCCALQAIAQTKITGTVIGKADGMPLIGATVREVGTKQAAITDIDGNFTINVKPGAQLQITYVGCDPVTTKAANGMTVTLSDAAELSELVVTGYQVQRKADLTGAVSVVDVGSLKTTSDTDPMRALQGKVPGMTITSDGSPSGTGTITIRGGGSFNSDTSPLIVIDGVPTTQAMSSLNSADIESMQVLKDAASASIYGSRAANGVIIITTKKGKNSEGKVKVDINANWTIQTINRSNMMQTMNTSQYAQAMIQAALNDGIDPAEYAKRYGLNINASEGVNVQAYNPATGTMTGYTVNGAYDGYINANKTMRFSNTDWLDVITRTGFIQNYDATISRGTDKGSTLFSVGYKRNDGILKYTNFQNVSTRLNTSYNFGKAVTVGENLTLTYTTQVDCPSGVMENALKSAPIIPIFEEDRDIFAGPVGNMSNNAQNPARQLAYNKDNSLNVLRIFGNAYVDIRPIKNLLIHSSFGVDFDAASKHSISQTYKSDVVNQSTSSASVTQANDMRWTWTTTANYLFDIAKVHHFNVLGGYEVYKQTRTDMSATGEDYDLETLDYMWPDAAKGKEYAGGTQTSYALVSYIGKLDYNWDDRILTSFTIRHDGSSRFGKNNRYATFPAATFGYRISRDLKKDWMDDLKFRFSWGKTGNQAIDNNARYNLYYTDYGSRDWSTAYDLTLSGSGTYASGYRSAQTASNNLKWETTEQTNLGLDFMFLNKRLYGTADFYIKNISDMLINPAYLGAYGEGGASWVNGPSARNTGCEFTLGWRDQLKCGLGYKINGNLDFYRSKVTSLPESATGSYAHTTTQNLVQAEKPYGSIVGYVVDGLYQSEAEVLASGQTNARVGGLKYKDLNGDGKITSDDETWIYNPVPDFSFGLNIELTYKNWDMSMFFQGVCGKDVWNDQKYQTDFWSIVEPGYNKGDRVLDAWTAANTGSTIPALTTNNTADEGRSSSYFVENGSYVKMRTLQIGYNFSKKLISKIYLDHARVYVSAQNLFTLKSSSLTCSDPETPGWAYPKTTSFSLGIQVGF